MNAREIIPNGIRICGWYILILTVLIFCFETVRFSSIWDFVHASVICIMMLLCALFALTLCYTFNDNYFVILCCFFKKEIPIYTITNIKYCPGGIYFLTIYRGMLNSKYEIPVMLLCSKKKSIKKLQPFIDFLSNNNCVCNIDDSISTIVNHR
jgi:hypothetical protein